MNINEIRKRHESDERGDPSFYIADEQTHQDRGELLKKVEELEDKLQLAINVMTDKSLSEYNRLLKGEG